MGKTLNPFKQWAFRVRAPKTAGKKTSMKRYNFLRRTKKNITLHYICRETSRRAVARKPPPGEPI